MYWDVEGSLLAKLAGVGFDVVRSSTEPHELTLVVEYKETKGEPFAINRFGTVIEGKFLISHAEEGPLFDIFIRETSQPSVSGTPPYLDVLHNFLSNPYYHYLGEIVREEIRGVQDPHAILMDSLRDEISEIHHAVESNPVSGHAARPQHSMELDKNLYAPLAVRRTIDELVKMRDERLGGLLQDLVHYPDLYVQVRSIEAFGDLGLRDAIPFLENLRAPHQRIEIRSAAQNAIEQLTTFTH